MELTEKLIEITIEINEGTAAAPKYGDKVTLSGLRMKVTVLGGVMSQQGVLEASIHGLTREMMQRLTTTGFIKQENRLHKIMVAAGNKGEALTVIYTGIIDTAYANIQQPNSEFHISASTALNAALTPVGASSYQGSKDVAIIMADFAKEAGWQFVNNGVKKVLDNAYFSGTTWEKIKKCAKAAGCGYDNNLNTLKIWPLNESKKSTIKVSSEPNNTPQMVATPRFSGNGLTIKTLFYPDFRFNESFEVVSKDSPVVNGLWMPINVVHELECKSPGGAWFTSVDCKRGEITL